VTFARMTQQMRGEKTQLLHEQARDELAGPEAPLTSCLCGFNGRHQVVCGDPLRSCSIAAELGAVPLRPLPVLVRKHPAAVRQFPLHLCMW
jgi:hypothetical protein